MKGCGDVLDAATHAALAALSCRPPDGDLGIQEPGTRLPVVITVRVWAVQRDSAFLVIAGNRLIWGNNKLQSALRAH